MYGILELLFGRVDGGLTAVFVVARLIGVLLMCASLFLLGRRNELGWWLAGGAFLLPALAELPRVLGTGNTTPTGLLLTAASFMIILVLTVGVAIYGLLLFRKHPLESGMTRAITLRQPRALDFLPPIGLAIVYGAAALLSVAAVMINYLGPGALSRLPLATLLVGGIIVGLLPAGLLGLANRSRWAWFLIVIASLGSLFNTVSQAAGSVLIFLYLLQGAMAFYGWARWGTIPVRAVSSSPTPVKPTF